jgi:4-hydroxybenzoate polyprenyltransferase
VPEPAAPSFPAAALAHTRPRSWPVVAGHLLAGAIAGAPPDRLVAQAPWILAAAALWAVALNGGTLALNGAVDRDEGDVGYLDAPPAPPRGLAAFGLGLMAAGLAAAWGLAAAGAAGPALPWLFAGCLLLSLLYSVPPIRLKARAGWDLLVNMAGYGAATFLAGWAATGAPPDAAILVAGAGFGLLFAALYPLTQIYQIEEDARSGARTLAVRLGRRRALALATAAAALALAALALALALRRPGTGLLWAALPLALPVVLWMRVLLPHLVTGGTACGKEAMYAGLRAWAVTDLVAALALAPGLLPAA